MGSANGGPCAAEPRSQTVGPSYFDAADFRQTDAHAPAERAAAAFCTASLPRGATPSQQLSCSTSAACEMGFKRCLREASHDASSMNPAAERPVELRASGSLERRPSVVPTATQRRPSGPPLSRSQNIRRNVEQHHNLSAREANAHAPCRYAQMNLSWRAVFPPVVPERHLHNGRTTHRHTSTNAPRPAPPEHTCLKARATRACACGGKHKQTQATQPALLLQNSVPGFSRGQKSGPQAWEACVIQLRSKQSGGPSMRG